MKAKHLLRLYPPAWRERYGEEFLDMAGEADLSFQQIIDITSGAIDAWLSAEVRQAARAGTPAANGGHLMILKAIACTASQPRYTTRDSIIGAVVLTGGALIFALGGSAARREGWTATADVLRNLALFGPMMLSTPFWLMKGQPWKAQAVIVGGTLAILVAASLFSAT